MCRKLGFKAIGLAWLLLLAGVPLQAQKRAKLLPDHATLQWAGSLGVLAAGAGYRNPHKNIEGELLLGYLPPSVGGDRLFTTALKSNWLPLKLFPHKKLHLYPLQTGVMLSYTFSSQFFGLPPAEQYPKGYYTFSEAFHAYWQLGSRLSFPMKQQRLELYYELNASAEELITLAQNRGFITPAKIFNLALGVKLSFEP